MYPPSVQITNAVGLTAYIRENDCDGTTVASKALASNTGDVISFTAPSEEGDKVYAVCIDLDSDGTYESNEKAYVSVSITAEGEVIGGMDNTMYIILGIIVIVAIVVAVYFYTKKK